MYVADLRARSTCWATPKLVQIFGQGESPMTITSLARDEHLDAMLHTCGRARTLVDVRVVDDERTRRPDRRDRRDRHPQRLRDARLLEQPRGERRRAARRLAAHRRSRQPGRARLLTLKDRAKDMIISGGSNIYPREIEEVLLRHAARAGSVRGRPPASRLGRGARRVRRARDPARAWIPPSSTSSVSTRSRATSGRARTTSSTSLPKNNYGKVLKTVLRERLKDATPQGGSKDA